jgi:hypothetical protein
LPDDDAFGVPATPPVKSAQLQRGSNDRLSRVPIFKVQQGEALPENLRLMISLDTEPLPGVQSSEALLQPGQDVIVH